jgi:hypothetical protein
MDGPQSVKQLSRASLTLPRVVRSCLHWTAGLLGFFVMLCGLYSAMSVDVRFSPVLSVLYCILPILSFPALLIGFLARRAALLQPMLALAYLAVYSALNWRYCSALGSCAGWAATVSLTIATPAVLAFFGAAAANLAAMTLGERN